MYMTILSILQHYFEYLRSPPVLLAILVIVGPISLELFKNIRLAGLRPSTDVPGCFRLGNPRKSQLDNRLGRRKDETSTVGSKNARIKALFTYPVKSCRGVELTASEVVPTGLKYDRLLTFAQCFPTTGEPEGAENSETAGSDSAEANNGWRFITQREFPRLALVETEIWAPKPQPKKTSASHRAGKHAKLSPRPDRRDDRTGSEKLDVSDTQGQSPDDTASSSAESGGCLILSFPYEPRFNPFHLLTKTISLRIPLAPSERHMADKDYVLEPLSIWTDHVEAVNITGEICRDDLGKLKAFLGVKNALGLFRVDPSHPRTITRSLPKDRTDERYVVGFGDAFPLHLVSMASVHAQDDELPPTATMKGKLDARRFRANIYVTGAPQYDEDSWKRINVGRGIKPKEQTHAKGTANTGKTVTVNEAKFIETNGEYHVACRTARCKLPNVDQESGVRDAYEPLTTLTKTRKVDPGAYPHPCLGVQMIPLFKQGILRIGDEIQVLERGEHHYEKMLS